LLDVYLSHIYWYMTIKELKEKLQFFPDDARIEINLEIKVNSQSSTLQRNVDSVNYLNKNNVVIFNSNWPVQLFY